MTKENNIVGLEYQTDKTSIKVMRKTSIKNNDGKYLYEVHCTNCSKDKDLFPDPILFSKATIDRQQVSCGCGKSPRWTEMQFRVLVKRKCELHGFVFLDLIGEFNGNKTKVRILDPSNMNVWESQTINKVLGRGPSNPHNFCKPEDKFISEMESSGKFVNGTKFFRCGESWFYSCPVCSYDEYVNKGLCDGKFRSTRSNLRQGKKSCRCSSAYRPSQEQVNFKVNCIIKGKGVLLSTGDWYRGNRSKLKYLCLSCERESSISCHDLFRGSFCKNCCKTGYSTDKPGRLYLVKWFGNSSIEFLKFGITNLESMTRIKKQKSKSGLDYEVVLDLYFKDGTIPLTIEDKIKEKFESGIIPKEIFPDGFTETLPYIDLNDVSNFITTCISEREV